MDTKPAPANQPSQPHPAQPATPRPPPSQSPPPSPSHPPSTRPPASSPSPTPPEPVSASTPRPPPDCPWCRSSQKVVRNGSRRTRRKTVQRYLCRKCRHHFSTEPLGRTSYPADIVLKAISLYNMGHTLDYTAAAVSRRAGVDGGNVHPTTVRSWIVRYGDVCTFGSSLRKRFTLDPSTLIASRRFEHQQVYDFKYHTLKLNIAGKAFPELKEYLRTVQDHCPDPLFLAGERCSSLRISIDPQRTGKNNNALRLAELAQALARNNRERHSRVEEFMLINDTATVAVEVPVYLYPEELSQAERDTYGLDLSNPLTGHIDIIQVRYDKIHVLDFKPGLTGSEARPAEQVFLYALALSKRTRLPLDRFVCAFFDHRNYFQFLPTDISVLETYPEHFK